MPVAMSNFARNAPYRPLQCKILCFRVPQKSSRENPLLVENKSYQNNGWSQSEFANFLARNELHALVVNVKCFWGVNFPVLHWLLKMCICCFPQEIYWKFRTFIMTMFPTFRAATAVIWEWLGMIWLWRAMAYRKVAMLPLAAEDNSFIFGKKIRYYQYIFGFDGKCASWEMYLLVHTPAIIVSLLA